MGTNKRTAMTHDLKIVNPHFEQVRDGIKEYEIRFDDREYLVGDLLIFREHKYSPSGAIPKPTGQKVERKVKHVLKKAKGLMNGYVILGFE